MEFANIKEMKVKDLAEAKEYLATSHIERVILPLYKTQFIVDDNVPKLKCNGDFNPLTWEGFKSFCHILTEPVPVNFAVHIPRATLDKIVRDLKKINKEVVVYMKTEPPCILNFTKYPHYSLKNADMVSICDELLQQKELAKIHLTDVSLEIEMKERTSEEILPGDNYFFTVRVVNSEVGVVGAYTQVGLLRSECWNSALISDKVRWAYDYRRSYEYNLNNFRNKVINMNYQTNIAIDSLRNSIARKMTDEEVVRVWRALRRTVSPWYADKIIGIDSEIRKRILTRVNERYRPTSHHYHESSIETEFTTYEIGNKITEYARDTKNFLLRNRLECLGGSVLLLN